MTEKQMQEPVALIDRLINPEQHYEFTDPKKANAVLMSLCQEAADALAAPVQGPVATLFGSLPVYDTTPPAAQQEHEPENEPHVSLASVREDWGPGPHEYHSLPSQPAPVPTSWMEMVTANLVREGVNKHKARELAEHFYTTPPAAKRQWVGLTVLEQADCFANTEDATEFYHAIEAKLKEKNSD
jgi:hypothetical protein